MENLILLMFSVHLGTGGTHSLWYIYTAVTPGINFPEFTTVGLVDGEQFFYYDSTIRRSIPKTEWIKKIDVEDPGYWDSESRISQIEQETFKGNMDELMKRFNHTEGLHTVQEMYGCELNDDGTTRAFRRFGYDGEDFIVLDLKTTLTYTAVKPQAEITKINWESDPGYTNYWRNYLEKTCIVWLKRYLDYRSKTLERKVRPEGTVFQRQSPSSEVVCHATGFFPKSVNITWQKDREDVYEDEEFSETLPNHDGSFQKRSVLKVSAEELQKHNYTCVIQHSSSNLVLHVNKREIQRVTHSLQYIYTAVTPGIKFPEFTDVGQVDGEQIDYYDSNIRREIPKTEWIKRNVGEDYWNRETQVSQGTQESFKVNVDTAMKRFNQTSGVHTVQFMYGCELHYDGTTRGYMQYGYDGEDFLSLDLQTETWTAVKRQAVITKNKWDSTGAEANHAKNYLKNTCIDWLRKYVSFGKETLERKVRPEGTVFQRQSPSSELVCHATGFFPKSLNITWQKDGKDVYGDVDLGETLPNHDGSFQKRSVLKVLAEELQKHNYTCVIQHSSLEEELVLPVSERRILRGGAPIGIIIGVVMAIIVLIAVIGGLVVWKKNSGENSGYEQAAFNSDSASDRSDSF